MDLVSAETLQFLGCTHVMRRTCWCTKQWQNVAQVLHNNRTKFPKDFFHHVLYTNMAAVTSDANQEYEFTDLREGLGVETILMESSRNSLSKSLSKSSRSSGNKNSSPASFSGGLISLSWNVAISSSNSYSKQNNIVVKAWFPYHCICRICRVCRTKKIHRTDRIHSILYSKLYLSFLLHWAFVREISIKLYLSYEFFSYNRHDRYNDMETRLKGLVSLFLWGNEVLSQWQICKYHVWIKLKMVTLKD